MSLWDSSDEELVELALRELPSEEAFSLRDREEVAPVSRGTLSRWDDGHRGLQKQTRRAVFVWLVELGRGDATDQRLAEELRRQDDALASRIAQILDLRGRGGEERHG